MIAKEYLSEIRMMETKLRSIEEEVLKLESRSMRLTATWQSDPVQTSRTGTGMADAVIKTIEMKAEYEKTWDELIDRRRECEQLLSCLKNKLHCTILFEYYVKGKNWEQVSELINYSLSYTKSLGKIALDEFDEVLKVGTI